MPIGQVQPSLLAKYPALIKTTKKDSGVFPRSTKQAWTYNIFAYLSKIPNSNSGVIGMSICLWKRAAWLPGDEALGTRNGVVDHVQDRHHVGDQYEHDDERDQHAPALEQTRRGFRRRIRFCDREFLLPPRSAE